MIITSWKGKRVVVCNCCMIHKGEDGDNGKGWYHNGKVDYCPKCAKLILEEFQTNLGQP